MSLIRRIFGFGSSRPVITLLGTEDDAIIAAPGACHCSNGVLFG